MGETEYKTSIEKIFRVVLAKLWIIITVSVIAAVIMAVATIYLINPVYSSTAKFYVQNDATGINESLTSQDLSAAKSLVDTYIVMIKTDTVLKEVADLADVDYDPEELSDMMKFAVEYEGPIAVRYPRGTAYDGYSEHRALIQYGKSELICEGK